MTTMDLRGSNRTGFLAGFGLMTLIGWALGLIVLFAVGWTITGALLSRFGVPDNATVISGSMAVAMGSGFALGGLAAGAVVGLLQGLMLGERVGGAGRWLRASALGGGLGFGIGPAVALGAAALARLDPESSAAALTILATIVIAGGILGYAQYRLLHERYDGARWWIVAVIVGVLISLGAAYVLELGDSGATALALISIGISLVTVPVMAWLLARPRVAR